VHEIYLQLRDWCEMVKYTGYNLNEQARRLCTKMKKRASSIAPIKLCGHKQTLAK